MAVNEAGYPLIMKETTHKNHKAKILWGIIICLLVLGFIGSLLPSESVKKTADSVDTNKPEKAQEQSSSDGSASKPDSDDQGKSAQSSFSITMLDVGQGLSLLIQSDGHYMLYDGGGRKSSSYVVSYLRTNDISSIDYLVASHYDEDHISGLVGALNSFDIGKALIPDYVADTQIFNSFIKKIESTGTDYEHPTVGEKYSLGEADFQIIGPENYDNEDDNDNSIVIRFQYGSNSCLLTGDASEKEEKQLLDSELPVSADLYVLGHHGSATSSSDTFLDSVSPKYAFLSVGEDNTYGHPTERVLSSLKNRNVELYRTDKQGNVNAFSDGETWWFDQEPCNDWSSGNEAQNKEAASAAPLDKSISGTTYVLNTHTKKYHYPDCSSVSRMKDENKETVISTPDQLNQRGYSRCGICQP